MRDSEQWCINCLQVVMDHSFWESGDALPPYTGRTHWHNASLYSESCDALTALQGLSCITDTVTLGRMMHYLPPCKTYTSNASLWVVLSCDALQTLQKPIMHYSFRPSLSSSVIILINYSNSNSSVCSILLVIHYINLLVMHDSDSDHILVVVK